ncbi:MAG: hypothetical protein QM669_05675 [Siphonobacter sp.]
MNANSLKQVPLLTLLLVAGLLLFSYLPPWQWESFSLKSVNILADLEADAPQVAKQRKPLPDKKEARKIAERSCPAGVTCIEDFSAHRDGMKQIMQALAERSKKEPVRIAFFGDSFIEGDMICGYFRDTLQNVFGGRGVGYVPIASQVAAFRATIRHQFQNIKTYSVLAHEVSGPALGASGFSFVPEGGNYVNYSTSRPYGASQFDHVRIFYKSKQPSYLYYVANGTEQAVTLKSQNQMSEIDLPALSNRVRMSFDGGLTLYGVSFEADSGVYVDNFSIRGNSGWGLLGVSEKMYRQFNEYQHYKLVILQYGLNVIQPNTRQLGWYVPKMLEAIERIKKGFPEASILLIGVSDRSTRQQGNYISFPSIPYLIEAQRGMARKTGVTFWNLWEAMGGEGSMVKLVDAGLANKDYTHLKYAGGQKIARLLAQALLFEKKKYYDQKPPVASAERLAVQSGKSSDSRL